MQAYGGVLVELGPSTTPGRVLARSKLSGGGVAMGKGTLEGDYLCIGVDSLPWVVGRARGRCEVWPESKGRQYIWMGWVGR